MTTHLTHHYLTFLFSRLQNKKEVATSPSSSPTWKQSMMQNQLRPNLQVQLGLHQTSLQVRQPQSQARNRATFPVIVVDQITKIEKLLAQKNRNWVLTLLLWVGNCFFFSPLPSPPLPPFLSYHTRWSAHCQYSHHHDHLHHHHILIMIFIICKNFFSSWLADTSLHPIVRSPWVLRYLRMAGWTIKVSRWIGWSAWRWWWWWRWSCWQNWEDDSMKHNPHQLSSHLCHLVLFWSLHSKVWKVH